MSPLLTGTRLAAAAAAPFLVGVLVVDSPEIGEALGTGATKAAWVVLIVAFTVAGRVMSGRQVDRCARLAVDGCLAAGVLTVLTSQAGAAGAVTLSAFVVGILLAASAGPSVALLAEGAPDPGGVVAAWWATQIGAAGIGALSAVGLSSGGFTWRTQLMIVGLLLCAVGLVGRLSATRPTGSEAPRGTGRTASGLRDIETSAQALTVASLAGIALVMLPGRLTAVLQVHDQLASPTRPLLVSLVVSAGALALAMEPLQARVSRLPKLSLVAALAAAAGLLVVGSLLGVPLAVVCTAVAMALLVFVIGQAAAALVATVPSSSWAAGLALVNVSVFLLGGALGSFLLGGIATRYGEQLALAILGVPTLAAVLPARRLLAALPRDAERLLADQESSELVAEHVRTGKHLPLLSCQRVSYAYGPLQVLFDVDFTVDEGELVALLGTNGAGKSSLLRAISGLGLPTGGTIHLQGHEMTRLSAEQRVGLGVIQVPGGRAVFPPLSVVDNLRVYGNSLGRDRRAVERGIERSFEFFPALAQARNRPAGALSGGQQQMVALSKALILQPKLLLIDELSLGLAPKVVGELLEAVRSINQDGTAVVLVEQSVNIAVSIAKHAYFMEKGRILFDGPAAGLMERTDLLRAVFLRDADPVASTSPAQR